METYDEYELLMLSKGRCAQDDYYLEPLAEKDLPDQIWQRYQRKVVMVFVGRAGLYIG